MKRFKIIFSTILCLFILGSAPFAHAGWKTKALVGTSAFIAGKVLKKCITSPSCKQAGVNKLKSFFLKHPQLREKVLDRVKKKAATKYKDILAKSPVARKNYKQLLDAIKEPAKKISSRTISSVPKQLQRKFKHAKDFGVKGNYSSKNANKFKDAIENHINKPGVKKITGTFRGDPVKFYTDPKTGLTVIEKNGSFLSGWRVQPEKLSILLKEGKL